MELTKSLIKAKRPCTDGFRWFVRHYTEQGHYQELLDALVAEGRNSDACWLLDQFGPTDALRVVDSLDAESVVFAGTLKVLGNVEAGTLLRVGRKLLVGGGIRVDGELIVGEDLRTGGGIRCAGRLEVGGELRTDWGVDCAGPVFCGGRIRINWDLQCGARLEAGEQVSIGLDLHAAEIICRKGLQVGGSIKSETSLRASQGIVARESIETGQHLEAGWGIRAGVAIEAGGTIRAGESLTAGEIIRAGNGYGIFAGLDVPLVDWEQSARVDAATRPGNLMSGYWVGHQAA